MSQDDDPSTNEPVGTVAEEAAKLLGALSGWARDLDDHVATGAAECSYCPICRTVHALRQTSPEVRTQLATAATALLQAASGLLATVATDQPDRGGVEHIDLDDTGDWPADPDEQTDVRPDVENDPEEGDR
jgi:hypothetical protein